MKRCFIVAGGEKSGTRLATRILIAAGCLGIATADARPEFGGWPQFYDLNDPQGETPIVIRRTLPYHPGRQWVELEPLIDRIKALGYDITIIFTVRSSDCTAKSLVVSRYVANFEEGLKDTTRANSEIQAYIARSEADSYVLPYECLVDDSKKELKTMSEAIGLDCTVFSEPIFDGNAQYKQ